MQNASNQFYVISRIRKFMGIKEKEILSNSFYYSNFNYCSLLEPFWLAKSLIKIEKNTGTIS